MTPETQRIQPCYGSTFQCIGSECEDSCCHGMSVLVDKKTYESYQAFPEEKLGSLVRQYVSINMISASVSLYARISPNSDNQCPFLSVERLCGVQKEYGSELLSATCSTYPRALNSVEDELEISLYLSCPQAARQVLLDANSTDRVGDASSGHFRTDKFSRLATTGNDSIHKPIRYFREVRELVVAVIQDRRRPLWQRLFLLGMLCQRLDEIGSAEQDDAVPEILSLYVSLGVGAWLRFSCREEDQSHADSQIICWDGCPQGDHLDQRCRRRAERPRAVPGSDSERGRRCSQDGEATLEAWGARLLL